LQNPHWALQGLEGLVVIDEIQLAPHLFSILRVLADEPDNPRRFLILGSASPQLMKQTSQTLAGRVEFIEMTPFHLGEIGSEGLETLWIRGGYPRSFLGRSEADSLAWREGFVRTFLERDIPQLGLTIAPTTMRRFWTMLAHYHGQIWNASEIGRSLGVGDKTVRAYLDILSGTYMIRQLQPWYENIAKRQVKSPKIYFRDSGLLHHLLGIDGLRALEGHPKLGASWEGFALEQFLNLIRPNEAYFWGSHGGAEIDLMFLHAGKRYGVEVKFAFAPKLTRSIQFARDSLGLHRVWILHPGPDSFPINDWAKVLALSDLAKAPGDLFLP
jgi:predicted AAA+ superfamily ATPase